MTSKSLRNELCACFFFSETKKVLCITVALVAVLAGAVAAALLLWKFSKWGAAPDAGEGAIEARRWVLGCHWGWALGAGASVGAGCLGWHWVHGWGWWWGWYWCWGLALGVQLTLGAEHSWPCSLGGSSLPQPFLSFPLT